MLGRIGVTLLHPLKNFSDRRQIALILQGNQGVSRYVNAIDLAQDLVELVLVVLIADRHYASPGGLQEFHVGERNEGAIECRLKSAGIGVSAILIGVLRCVGERLAEDPIYGLVGLHAPLMAYLQSDVPLVTWVLIRVGVFATTYSVSMVPATKKQLCWLVQERHAGPSVITNKLIVCNVEAVRERQPHCQENGDSYHFLLLV